MLDFQSDTQLPEHFVVPPFLHDLRDDLEEVGWSFRPVSRAVRHVEHVADLLQVIRRQTDSSVVLRRCQQKPTQLLVGAVAAQLFSRAIEPRLDLLPEDVTGDLVWGTVLHVYSTSSVPMQPYFRLI